jgi:hypothetical protein
MNLNIVYQEYTLTWNTDFKKKILLRVRGVSYMKLKNSAL